MPAPPVLPVQIPADVRADHPEVFADNKRGRLYHNPWLAPSLPGFREVLRWKLGGEGVPRPPDKRRARPQPLAEDPLARFARVPEQARLLWIGHASFHVELDGVHLVIDPIFGRAAGLMPRVTRAAATASQLPTPHAVLVSHGHHDHLDPASLRQLARAHGPELLFVVPKDLGRCLPRACARVVELDWWQRITLGVVDICLVPAQHWHNRVIDKDRSLWGGWVIRGSRTIYHSGDTGYFAGFRAIGRVFGGVDIACLPLGAYEPEWFMGPQHMSPQGSLQAFEDLQATHFVGMHWGSFDLSDEAVDAGPEALLGLVRARGIERERIHVLRHGGALGLRADGSAESTALVHG